MLDNIKIITSKKECESLLISSGKLLEGNYEYKKILNDFYAPDEFLFFVDGKDILPLVIKDNLVSFYGGFHYNEYNIIPKNEKLLDFSLVYMKEKGLSFRLLSIRDDYIDILDDKGYDVPYGANWEIDDLGAYSFENILQQHKSKERNNLLRPIKKIDEYTIKQYHNLEYIDEVLYLSSQYFKNRNITFGWDEKEELFSNIMKYFDKNYNIVYKIFYKENKMHGSYILLQNNEELLYFFGGPLINDNNISTLIYYDLLNESNNFKAKSLDAMRGSFGYKKKLGFKPKPLYAMVKDDNWTAIIDKDFTTEEYNELFSRDIKVEDKI